MALTKQPLLVRLIFFCLTIFWGFWILFSAVIKFIRNPRKFLYAKNYVTLPSCALDSALGSHKYITFQTTAGDCGELTLKYVCNGEKGKPLMLLLHGFPESWYSWRYQLKEFSDQYWVVALDMRGYGDSDKPGRLENYLLDYLVADVASVITELGYETATVVGHDWGGAITWNFASRYPDMCDKVVILNCPHPSVHRKHMMTSVKQFLASWYMFYFCMPYLPEIMLRSNDFGALESMLRGKAGIKNKENMTDEDLDMFKYSLNSWESRVASLNYYRANFTYKSQKTKTIEPAMLIVWGTGDLFLTKQLAQDSTKYASSCELVYVEGASHWVQQDQPQTVNKHMRDFLSKS